MDVYNIVQEAVIKTIPKGKKMQKGKMVVWGCLTNSWERKRSEWKWRKEKIYPSNTEFQRKARRGKKAFLSEHHKEIEEKYRMGKNRDLLKKTRDTKWTFHAKMGTIKDRNCMDLTEAEDVKKRWQEYTKQLYKILTTQKTMMVWSLTLSQASLSLKADGP